MRERLIVGLDVPTLAEAEKVVRDLDGVVSFYKIGYQLAFAGGLDFARELASGGTKVFLDMKLLDIDNTVAKGVENIVKMGVSMLTLHAYPKAMRAAVEAAKGSRPLPARRHRADLDGRAGPDRGGLRIRPAHAGAAPRRAGARRRHGRHRLLGRRGGGGAQDRRAGACGGDAGHPAGRRRARRPEARDDAGRRDPRRRQPSRRGRPIVKAPDRRAAAQAILAEMGAA